MSYSILNIKDVFIEDFKLDFYRLEQCMKKGNASDCVAYREKLRDHMKNFDKILTSHLKNKNLIQAP